MSEITKIIEKYYKAFNEKRFSEMLSYLDDHVVHYINEGGVEVGRETFKRFLDVMNRHYDENLSNIVIFSSPNASDRASAEFICNGRYLNTAEGLPPAKGQTYSLPVGAFFEVKNDRITRITNYYNLNDWIRQVSK